MTSFKDLQLPMPILQTLNKMNFVELTEVQEKSIPDATKRVDIVVCAQTGSGKTLAYSLPLLKEIFENPSKGGLILAPSRELARQIADVVRPLVESTKNLKMSVVVGGTDMRRQVQSLKRNPQIIIATPGRLNDHLRRRTVQLGNFDNLVLDEGDRMLDMGFAPQLDEIFKFMPKKRHTMLFTATLPAKVKSLIKDYMVSPKEITIGERSQPVSMVKQKVILIKPQLKDDRLVDELNKREGSVIIFSKTKVRTDKLSKYLNEFGFKSLKIHGDRSQGQRNKAIEDFRSGRSRILCATDVVARGLDIPHVKHVINYDLPMMDEDYVHRVGRTARNGATGEALSFVTPQEKLQWKKIQRKYKLEGIDSEGEFEFSDSRSHGGGGRGRFKSEGGGRSRSGNGGSGRGFSSGGKKKASGGGFGSRRGASGSSAAAGGSANGGGSRTDSKSRGGSSSAAKSGKPSSKRGGLGGAKSAKRFSSNRNAKRS